MPDSLTWLAVDTAMNACGVAVRHDGKFYSRIEPMERGQAERLMPLILEMTGQAGIALADIDAYAVAHGPGTFTGLRVGLATIRALAQVSGKPAIGVGTFDVIADTLPTASLCILIETKRSDYYVRAPGIEDGCVSPEDLRALVQPGWTLAGDAIDRAQAELGLANPAIRVTSMPLDAMIRRAEKTQATGLPEPVYLRNADVSIARKKPARIV